MMLLNPFVSFGKAYDADALALFGRMTVEPSSKYKNALNDFIVGGKDYGLYTLLDTFALPLKSESQQAGLLDFKRSSVSYTLQGVASFDPNFGFVNSATSGSYINTQFKPSSDGAHMTNVSSGYYIYVTEKPTASTSANFMPFAASSGPPYQDATQIFCTSSGQFGSYSAVNSAFYTFGASAQDCVGLISLTRTSVDRADLWKNGSILSSDVRDFTGYGPNLPNRNIPLGATLDNTTYRDFTGIKIGAFGAGAPLTLTQQTNLKTLIDNYISAMA